MCAGLLSAAAQLPQLCGLTMYTLKGKPLMIPWAAGIKQNLQVWLKS